MYVRSLFFCEIFNVLTAELCNSPTIILLSFVKMYTLILSNSLIKPQSPKLSIS